MVRRRKTPVLTRMEEAVTKVVTRSPLTVWLEENRVGFADLVERHGPRWEALAAVLADEGVRAADDKPISGETLRGAWRRLQRRREKPGRKPPAPSAAKPVQQPSPVARPTSPDPTPADPQPQPQQPSGTGSKADEQIARLKEHWRAQKSKMPDPL